MRELCISFENDVRLNLTNLIKNLKELGCIVVKLHQTNNEKLVIATDNLKFVQVEYVIKCFLVSNFLKRYKKIVIKSLLKFDNDIKSKILLSSLINYDLQADNSYFLNKLDLSQDIYISSYINFKMQLLIKKWRDICTLTKNNVEILDVEAIYYSLIRYINDNGLKRVEEINAKMIKASLIEYNNKIFKTKDFLCYCNKIAPKKINLESKLNNFQYKNMFYKIFDKNFNFIIKK